MSEIMIDIETLGTSPNSVVMTIGAVKFNRTDDIKPLKEMETFYCHVSKTSCIKLGLDIDKETEEWWKNQSEEARHEVFTNNKNRYQLKNALIKLSNFIGSCDIIWANSPAFDCIILENCYKKCELPVPWKYYNLRDTRTAYDIGGIDIRGITVKSFEDGDSSLVLHHALNDCYRQIIALNRAFNKIGK